MSQLVYSLEDISNQLRVHLQASPLDDIVENAVEELEEIINNLSEDI